MTQLTTIDGYSECLSDDKIIELAQREFELNEMDDTPLSFPISINQAKHYINEYCEALTLSSEPK